MGENDILTGYMMGQNDGGGGGRSNGNGIFGGDGLWGLIIILALLGGLGNGNGLFGGGGGGNGGGNSMAIPYPYFFGGFGGCGGSNCATQADLAAGFNNSAVLSSLNDLKLGQAGVQQTLCQGFNGVNTTILQGFHGVDNAVCTLGYQAQQGFSGLGRQISDCCCDVKGAIKDVGTQSVMNTNMIQRQISDCCCDLEKMNMQNRFDAQGYNNNTLLAIDKLGDRIIGYLDAKENADLRSRLQRAENAESQSNQNAYFRATIDAAVAEVLRKTGAECPSAAYIVNPPTPVTFRQNGGCNSCCGNGYGNTYGFAA